MASQMPNVPYRSPITDSQGKVTLAWVDFFRQLFKRVGENSAPTNLELDATPGSITSLQTQITTLQGLVTTLQANVINLAQGQEIGQP